MPCDRFTVECGNPEMLKSMFSSLIARLNSLSVFNNAMSLFSSGANCSFTVCALELFRSTGFLFHRELAQHGCFQTDYQVSPIDLKNQVLCAIFFIDLVTNTSSVLSSFPDRSQIGLRFGWVSLENFTC